MYFKLLQQFASFDGCADIRYRGKFHGLKLLWMLKMFALFIVKNVVRAKLAVTLLVCAIK